MSEETIFSEVDEELRRERMRTLWRRFGPWMLVAAVLVVLAVAANEGWNWWQKSTAAASSDRFYTALELADAGDAAGAEAALGEVIADSSGHYPTLARFRQAALLATEGQPSEAVAAYDAIANAESDPRLRELALVMAANLLVDTGSLDDVLARAGTLAGADNPLRNAARESIGLAQYRAGQYDNAFASFQSILGDPLVTADQMGRIQVYLAQLTAEGAGDAPVVEEGEAAGESEVEAGAAPAPEAEAPASPEVSGQGAATN